MKQKILERVKEANPDFFDEESYGDFGVIKSCEVVEENGEWVLHLETGHGTLPVYSITSDYELDYLRHR
jgi:hypothetical protein